MKKRGHPVFVIFVGMVLSHLFFTWMVYRSNLDLHHNMQAVIEAGYLPVPNAHILPHLRRFGTALKAALFYTLTAGIFLPLLTYLAAWAWDRGYRRNRVFLIALSGFVIFCMMMLNRHGINPIVTLWFLTVYITVFKLTLHCLEGARTRLSPKHLITHLVLLAVLTTAWMTVSKDTNFFLSVRDHLLLTNSFGERITDFYYRYSPYPTHSYKALRKKQIKTCRIEGDLPGDLLDQLASSLLRYDYLPVGADGNRDMVIRISDNRLSFSVKDRTVLKTDVTEFLQSPSDMLDRVSNRSDRNDFTRKFLAFSLVFGLPIFLYACLFGFFQLVFGRLSGRITGFQLSAAGCLVVGIAAMVLFKTAAPASIPARELKTALESEDADIRVAAFRTIAGQGLDPSDYCEDIFTASRSSVPERIWWTISLGSATAPETNELLLQLLDDPHPLVACKAYDALAKRGYRPAIPTIIEKLGASRHWYVQGYAYAALRTLGWSQKRSS